MAGDSFTLSVNQLGKRYNREWIFRNFSHTFQSGQTYAITGPNGSGKSTLMQVLWGQLPPSAGQLAFHSGNSVIPVEDAYKHVSVATPYLDLVEELTLLELLRFHFNMRKPVPGHSIDSIIEKLYLTKSRDKQLINFSSGMKQRVKLGLAFFTESALLFLDEPGTNLDDEAFAWYKQNLAEVRPGKIVFIASNQKAEYPERAVVINLAALK